MYVRENTGWCGCAQTERRPGFAWLLSWDKTLSVSSMVTDSSPWFGLLGPFCCARSPGLSPHRRHHFAIHGRCIRMVRLSLGFGKTMQQFHTGSVATVAVASCVACQFSVTAPTTDCWTQYDTTSSPTQSHSLALDQG